MLKEEQVNTIIDFAAELLGIGDENFVWEFFKDLSVNYLNTIPAVFIRPNDIPDLDCPLIAINDTSNFDDFTMMLAIVHEVRHLWQYLQNNPKWLEEMNTSNHDLGFTEETSKENAPMAYINQEIEQDAYAFQVAFARMYTGDEKISLEVKHLFPDSFEDRCQKLYKQYLPKFKKLLD